RDLASPAMQVDKRDGSSKGLVQSYRRSPLKVPSQETRPLTALSPWEGANRFAQTASLPRLNRATARPSGDEPTTQEMSRRPQMDHPIDLLLTDDDDDFRATLVRRF